MLLYHIQRFTRRSAVLRPVPSLRPREHYPELSGKIKLYVVSKRALAWYRTLVTSVDSQFLDRWHVREAEAFVIGESSRNGNQLVY